MIRRRWCSYMPLRNSTKLKEWKSILWWFQITSCIKSILLKSILWWLNRIKSELLSNLWALQWEMIFMYITIISNKFLWSNCITGHYLKVCYLHWKASERLGKIIDVIWYRGPRFRWHPSHPGRQRITAQCYSYNRMTTTAYLNCKFIHLAFFP